jgi:putative nucleotidyltransferase with HDIG domain
MTRQSEGSPRPHRAFTQRLVANRGELLRMRQRLLSRSWLWGVGLVVVTTWLVAPRGAGDYPALPAGSIAPTDVVVHRPVTLPDPESTEEKRRQAALNVLPVYTLDLSVPAQLNSALARMFAEGRQELGDADAALAARLSKASGLVVSPAEAAVLRADKFSEELLTTLTEVVSRLYRYGVVANRLELLQSSERGITVRDTAGKEWVELDVYRFVDASSGLSETIEQLLTGEPGLNRRRRAVLASFLARSVTPNLVPDRGETLARRIKAASAVEDVSVSLPRGKVLVRRGDEVTPQTARLLGALAMPQSVSTRLWRVLGSAMLSVLLAASLFFFVRRETAASEAARSHFGALVLLTIFALLAERAAAFVVAGVAASTPYPAGAGWEDYLPALPHAAGPIVGGLMYGMPAAVLLAAIQAVLVSLMLGGETGVGVLAVISGIAGAFASQRLKERNVFARVGLLVAVVNVACVVGLDLYHGREMAAGLLFTQLGAATVGAMASAAVASFFLPVLESATGRVTDIRLLELSNPNLPLLKRLANEAPGTFQHSLAMANLAEAAAEAIGANALLVRVCCYYHDIGKLARPDYFFENQRGENPHDTLSPWMSSLVVSNHVKAGLELARQYRLPEPIREAIATHHGTKLIRYFYSRAKEQQDPDRGAVEESEFRYPGPRPRSKEMGILLLADAVEAASRTLEQPTPGKIKGMIDQIIENVMEDHQLDDCDLTLKDIDKIGAAFYWVLTNAFHRRIDYPGFDFNRRRG